MKLDAIKALLSKAGGKMDDGLSGMKSAYGGAKDSMSGLGASLAGGGQDYMRAGKGLLSNAGPMRPDDIKKQQLLKLLGLLGAGGAAGAGGYAMMDDEDE